MFLDKFFHNCLGVSGYRGTPHFTGKLTPRDNITGQFVNPYIYIMVRYL